MCKKLLFSTMRVFILLNLLFYFNSAFGQNTPDLKTLVDRAISQSQQIKIRQAQEQKATLDKKKAYQSFLPKITAEGSYTHLNDAISLPSDMENLLMGAQELLIKEHLGIPFNTPLPAGVPLKEVPPLQEQDIYKVNLNAQMLLFSGGKVAYSQKAAQHQLNAMKLLTDNEKETIISNVISTYDRLAVVKSMETVINQSEKYLNEQSRFVEKAISNGLAVQIDREKINLAKQQLQYKKIELSSGKTMLIARLSQLTGLPTDSLQEINPELKPWILSDASNNVENRSDLKALDEAILATRYKTKAEWAEYTPKVVAFGKKELITDYLSTFDPEWYVGVGIKWTLFDGLAAQNNAQQTKIDRYILEQKKEESTELLNLNLTKMQLEYQKCIEQLSVAEQRVKTSEEIHKLTLKQRDTGLINMADYLNSVNDFEKSKMEYIEATYNERVSAISMLEATGSLTNNNIQ